MTLTVCCPHCGKPGKIPENVTGRVISCPACAKTFAAQGQAQEKNVPLRWEYHAEDLHDFRASTLAYADSQKQREELYPTTLDGRLERLGRERWELVSATFIVQAERPFWKMIFKRPRS